MALNYSPLITIAKLNDMTKIDSQADTSWFQWTNGGARSVASLGTSSASPPAADAYHINAISNREKRGKEEQMRI